MYKKIIRLNQILRSNGGLVGTVFKVLKIVTSNRPDKAALIIKQKIANQFHDINDRRDYKRWILECEQHLCFGDAIKDETIKVSESNPLISIVMPVFNPPLAFLDRAITSIKAQRYTNWELCIADDFSNDADLVNYLEEQSKDDNRIKVVFRSTNGNISACTNSALEIASGEWIAFMDQDDELSQFALYEVQKIISQHPTAKLIYSDEDKIDVAGKRSDPYFKPDWNLDLFYSQNYICHFTVIKKEIVIEAGALRLGFEGAQDYDLILRVIDLIKEPEIIHIPKILYHWRAHDKSTAMDVKVKPDALDNSRKALQEHFKRQGRLVTISQNGIYHRVDFDLPSPPPLVSIIIPSKNQLELLKKCVESIFSKTLYPTFEVVIVDNGSDDPECLKYLDLLAIDERIKIVRDDAPFNYSYLNRVGVENSSGEVLAFLNNDVEVISNEWLCVMVSNALRPEIGAVGAKLLYTNGNIQHAGVILGIGGVAGHGFKNFNGNSAGLNSRLTVAQNYSAVTAACLVVRRASYFSVGGFNEKDLAVAFNDVDFCLKLKKSGLKNLWTPHAILFHHESVSRGVEDTIRKQKRFQDEVLYMKKSWPSDLMRDEYYNDNLTKVFEDFSLKW